MMRGLRSARGIQLHCPAPGAWLGLALLLLAPLSGCVSLPTREQLASLPAPHTGLPASDAVVDGRDRFRQIFCAVLSREGEVGPAGRPCAGWLWNLGDETASEQRPLPEADRSMQVVLVPGAFSECLGDYGRPFNDAATGLRQAGYRISTVVVGGRSGSEHNARQIAEQLAAIAPQQAGPLVLVGYSKGANDILEFLVRYPGLAARVEAVVSVAGAIGGSPMAAQAAGVYDLLLDSIPNSRCSPGDKQLIDGLTTEARQAWLAGNPLPAHVRYYSLAAFTTRPRIAAALAPVWKLLLAHDLRNDGQLLARDQLIPGATLLGYADADHWSVAVDVEVVHPILGVRRDKPPFPRAALLESILLQVAEARAAQSAAVGNSTWVASSPSSRSMRRALSTEDTRRY